MGIVTKVSIKCPTKPNAVSVAMLALDSFDKIFVVYQKAKQRLGEILSACEMMDAKSLECVTGHLKMTNPLGDSPFYMVIETQGSNGKHDEEKLNMFLEEIMGDGTIQDGTVTSEPGKSKVCIIFVTFHLRQKKY